MKEMKKATRILLWLSFALMFSAFINLSEVLGIIAIGIFTFCYVYDERFRRSFNV